MSSVAHEVELRAIGTKGHDPTSRLASVPPPRTGGCLVPEALLRLAQDLALLGHNPDGAADLGAVQYTLNEGPSLTAITEHRAYVVSDLDREPRWPRFARTAIDETGVFSVLALRLGGDSEHACLNLYSAQPAAFTETSIATGALLAAQSSSALTAVRAQARVTNLENQHLHRKLRDVAADVVHTGAIPTAPQRAATSRTQGPDTPTHRAGSMM
jgi:hypothetical protein